MTAKVDDAHAAAKQLEAFFLRQMLSEARPSGGGGALDGGFAGDTFKQMLDEAVADKVASAGGIGIANTIATQLAKQSGSKTAEADAGTAERPQASGLRSRSRRGPIRCSRSTKPLRPEA